MALARDRQRAERQAEFNQRYRSEARLRLSTVELQYRADRTLQGPPHRSTQEGYVLIHASYGFTN
jgi:hypothetical protein